MKFLHPRRFASRRLRKDQMDRGGFILNRAGKPKMENQV
jgi:hypothetical protein